MPADPPTRPSPRDFVLVHGAWHGGWCWDLVREQIKAAGHRVHTPTLPGLGERADELNAATGLADHIAEVVDYIAAHDLSDIVLAGHSYGGMVITGVADVLKPRIAHVLYLDAALPGDGQSMISYGTSRPRDEIAATEAALRSLAPDGVAMAAFTPELLGIPADHPLHDEVAARLTPHPLKTWFDPIRLINGGPIGLPRTYVHCTAPVMAQTQFPAIARMAQNDPGWHYAEIATGHEAMLTAPDAVAKLLLDTIIPLRQLSAQSHPPKTTAQEQA